MDFWNPHLDFQNILLVLVVLTVTLLNTSHFHQYASQLKIIQCIVFIHSFIHSVFTEGLCVKYAKYQVICAVHINEKDIQIPCF